VTTSNPLTAPADPPVDSRRASATSRAGRHLPAAIGVGVGFGALAVVCLLYFQLGFVFLVAAATAAAARELQRELQRQGMNAALVPILMGCVLVAVVPYVFGELIPVAVPMIGLVLICVAATVLAAMIWRMPQGSIGYVRDIAASLLIIAYVPLLGSFSVLMLAGEHGAARIVAFVLIVAMSDTGGLIAGVLFGRHPMAPTISPKKSWEGLAGSLIFGIAAGMGTAMFGLKVSFWVGIVLGVALVVVGTCGDLIESMIKRDLGIKDMSSFLPGHGGVMDRLDSLLFAAPVAWLIMYVLVPGG
jgi:phosphatidate cytidylyltransferase